MQLPRITILQNNEISKNNDMKTFRNSIKIFIPFLLLGGVLLFAACEPKVERGTPKIDFVRSTDPELADSTFTSAFMGQLVAIIGENLGGTVSVMFNDRVANLNPAYVTEESILVSVPNQTPDEINNKLTLTFDDGTDLEYDFVVDIPPPVIFSTVCEYVPDGGTMVINGDYFFLPTKVYFPGDVEAIITALFTDRVEVTVPAGSVPGQIKVETNFGEVLSPFLFRDNRQTIMNFDDIPSENWTAEIAYADSAPEIAPISGNYALVKSDAAAAWNWQNNLAIFCWGEGIRASEDPIVSGFIPDLDFRFEANVPITWNDIRMEIYFSPYGHGHGRDEVSPAFAYWTPWEDGPYTTDGWITISIPLTDFSNVNALPLTFFESMTYTDGTKYSNLNMMVFGPQVADAANTYPVQICIDNVRVVPREIE
jgi:hypothetical protein